MTIFVKAALAISALTLAPAAQAATALINVDNAHGYSSPDYSPDNTIITQYLDPYAWIKKITYDVTVDTPIILAGTAVWFGTTSDSYVQFLPDPKNENSGRATYSGTIDLQDLGVDFRLDDDGLLKLQFADYYAPYYNTADTTYSSKWNGWFNVEYDSPSAVPEPATWMMMLFGFGLLGAVVRRGGQVRGMRVRRPAPTWWRSTAIGRSG